MLKIRCAGDGSYHKPIKQLVTKVPAIELVTELIEVLLQELRLDTVEYVLHQRLRVADCDVDPREYFPDFLGVNLPPDIFAEHLWEVDVRFWGHRDRFR